MYLLQFVRRVSKFSIFHSVKLKDDNSIYRLIRGCPLLNELSMAGCIGKEARVIRIFAPVFTKLSIKHYDHDTYEIVLDTPGLLYLELDDDVKSVQGYLVKNLSGLIKVEINVGGPFGMESHEIISKAVTDLLVGISRVQHLVLQWRFIEVLDKCNYRLQSMFHQKIGLIQKQRLPEYYLDYKILETYRFLLSASKYLSLFGVENRLVAVAMTHPMAVSNCNIDVESLILDQNRSIATLAITTLDLL
ncbi:FBD-associated F-box protein At4g13985-like [Rhododendron vialii]|uniref:FBD-associated F-box protein At4g13985-like n=1 Tax=Rhododendron vialii TaxID=182163 RepID=UPI00265FFF5D|nr:FBD-associated F-box protein At4g13985-like [Rhododendron vialii]